MSKKEGKKEKPKIDFEHISKELADIQEKQHIDQIGPALTDVYIKHAKYKDEKGAERYKTKFNKQDAEKLADDVFDALAYHSHRRVFGIDQKNYDDLKKFKDANGVPYIDALTQFHYQINRGGLKKTLARDEKDNSISHGTLEAILEKPLQHHAGLLHEGIISKHGLNDPEHFEALKSAIDNIVEKYKLSKKIYNTKRMTPETALQNYIKLSKEHYRDEKE